MKSLKRLWWVVVLSFGFTTFASQAAHAQIVIDPGFEGSLVINLPGGTTQILNPGDPIPAIPNGATITLIGGKAQISLTDKDDKVEFVYLGSTFQLSDISAIKVAGDNKAGSLEVVDGKVGAGGQDLKTGDRYPITSNPEKTDLDPTAAGESLGSTPAGDSEPDSRDMAVSPGQ